MNLKRHNLTLLDGSITGIYATADHEANLPLLVFIHGGGCHAAIHDVPGLSQLATAATDGYTAIALDRPGHGGSLPLDTTPETNTGFAANAHRLTLAIAEVWEHLGASSPGIVVSGTSIGGAIACHLAAMQTTLPWPLLGVALSDIGPYPAPEIAHLWRSAPPQHRIELGPILGWLPQPPPHTTAPQPPSKATLASAFQPALRWELQEIIDGWPATWPDLAAQITIPVHYRIAAHDTMWEANPATVEHFAAAFNQSPHVDAALQADAAHNIALSAAAHTYNRELLAFARHCRPDHTI